MTPATSGTYNALSWVKDELQQTLADALQALTSFIDAPDERTNIDLCMTHMQQINGTLIMLNLPGAKLLASEIIESIVRLRENSDADNTIQDSILRGLLILPNYLNLLSNDFHDHPLHLIAILNELRTARGDDALATSSLFSPELTVALPGQIMPNPNRTLPKLATAVDKLSHAFQHSLLHWFKENDDLSLHRMSNIIRYLRLSCTQQRSTVVWWAAEGVIESILEKGLPTTPEIKLLLGKLTAPIKLFTIEGEQQFNITFPTGLTYLLLLQVARSISSGHHVSSLKETFSLNFFDPQQHQKIYSFTSNAFDDVHSELMKQLQQVKQDISDFHDHSQSAEDLQALEERLNSMAATFEVLTDLNTTKLLWEQADKLAEIASQGSVPSDDQLMSLANVLLKIEYHLQSGQKIEDQQAVEKNQLEQTVLAECLTEITAIQETFAMLADNPEDTANSITQITHQLTLIAGSLTILNLSDAAELVNQTAKRITQSNNDNGIISVADLTNFAEIIASVEIYMEGIKQGGTPQGELLQNAHKLLNNLAGLSDQQQNVVAIEDIFTENIAIADLETSLESTESNVITDRITPLDIEQEPEDTENSDPIPTEPLSETIEDTTDAVTPQQNNENNVITGQITLPDIEQKLTNTETSVSRYINALASNTEHPIAEPLSEYSEDTTHAVIPMKIMPSLIRYPPPSIEPKPDHTDLDSGTADNITDQSATESMISDYPNTPLEANDNETELTPSARFAEGVDPEIAEIFVEEAADILEQLAQLIPEWDQDKDEKTVAIRRHIHTLKGSGRMAGATIIGEVSWSIEQLLNKVIDGQQALATEIIDLVKMYHQLLPDLVSHFCNGDLEPTEQSEQIINRANALLSNETEQDLPEDNELQQLFYSEASQHITQFNHALSGASQPFQLNKELLHAAHSLKGCANIAQVTAVATIASKLDDSLRSLYQQQHPLDERQLSLLKTTINSIEHTVTSLKTGQTIVANEAALLADLDNMLVTDSTALTTDQPTKELDPELLASFLEENAELLEQLQQQQANNDQSNLIETTLDALIDNAQYAQLDQLTSLYQLQAKLIAQLNLNHNDKTISALIEQGYAAIYDQIASLKQNLPTPAIEDFSEQVANALEALKQPQQSIEATLQTADSAGDLFTIPNEEPELLEAFTEECAELLASSNQTINSWQQNHDDQQAILQLQRDLHTLKGSARLTGIIPIADLTHQTESLTFFAIDKKCATDHHFFTLLLRAQDRLAEMQEQLANKTRFAFANDLTTEIAHFTGQIEPSADEMVQTTKPLLDKPLDDKPEQVIQYEQIRVRADLLDLIANFAGEVNISHDRVNQQNTAIQLQLSEMDATVSRLQDQLRKLEIETENQILFRYEDEKSKQNLDFDPLELDRFSMIQQLSRGLTESVSDMNEINLSLNNLARETDTILLQQSRLSTDLQQELLNTRLLPFDSTIPRFERIIRQMNAELGKKTQLFVDGGEYELDRTILDRIIAPIEHIVRNAIAHGIEPPEQRTKAGKQETGTINIYLSREGSEILIILSDDGQGIDTAKIRQKAIEQQLINPDQLPTDEDLIQLILTSGFSTSDELSQISGRGVGMDVVNNEIRALKGRLSIQSTEGQGTTFNIRLPLTLSIMQALLVGCGEHQYAIPLVATHAGDRMTTEEITALLTSNNKPQYEYKGEYYDFIPLANLLNHPLTLPEDPKVQLPILLFHYGEFHIALLVDSINSNREIVLKPVGDQLAHIDAITGATILGDGQVVFVLDIPLLIDSNSVNVEPEQIALTRQTGSNKQATINQTPLAMVVDDSITMRKASGNLLKRHGFQVITARDGIDAVAQLNEHIPDIVLLDVEMPRMDGFEFATLVRNIDQYKSLPIIMITSRTGDKHRDRALSIGVNAYLGKPYQEVELMGTIEGLLDSATN